MHEKVHVGLGVAELLFYLASSFLTTFVSFSKVGTVVDPAPSEMELLPQAFPRAVWEFTFQKDGFGYYV